MIELTEAQRQALHAEPEPPCVVDPQTRETFVLVRREVYERVSHLLKDPAATCVVIPPGILRSQQAFWRDLPQLLAQKSLRGQWVCYHGNERVGIAHTEEALIRECLLRRLPDDAYDLFVIEPIPRPPWEPEEIDGGGHEVADAESFDGRGLPA